jgi:hypothetical protein
MSLSLWIDNFPHSFCLVLGDNEILSVVNTFTVIFNINQTSAFNYALVSLMLVCISILLDI